MLWCKFDKKYFDLDNDIYMCNCYIPPQNSPIWKQNTDNAFDILQKELTCFGTKGDIVLIGDFNSRTGNTQENLNNIRDLSDIDRLDIDIDTSIPNRHNEDQTVNTFGKELISTIEEARMIILNGRTLGDWQGAKTCYTYNGSSTVDYMIVSQGLFKNVATFRILEPEPLPYGMLF